MKTISMWRNVGRFTPPQNRQGRFTLQIVCMIYPPSKSPGKMEDLLLKSSVRFTPLPPEIAFISNFLAPKIDIN